MDIVRLFRWEENNKTGQYCIHSLITQKRKNVSIDSRSMNRERLYIGRNLSLCSQSECMFRVESSLVL